LSLQLAGGAGGAAPFGYRHDALFYGTANESAELIARFLRAGLNQGQPALAVIAPQQIERVRSRLGSNASRVEFADMRVVGDNPARIIPLWQEFLDRNQGRAVRGVGEPIWAGRALDELRECQIHEDLLNRAVPAQTPFWLVCPYSVSELNPEVIRRARLCHSDADLGGEHGGGGSGGGDQDSSLAPFAAELAEPPPEASVVDLRPSSLFDLRRGVSLAAARWGLNGPRISDLVLATNEVATNCQQHGQGLSGARIWSASGRLVCEVRGPGSLNDPLAGRRRPSPGLGSGRGLWLANHLCDLVQVMARDGDIVVRLHMRMV